jgi:hypothetical protein
METLKKNLPVLFSPKFQGLFLYLLLSYFQAKGWLGGEEMEHLTKLVGLATGVGFVDGVARKIGKK